MWDDDYNDDLPFQACIQAPVAIGLDDCADLLCQDGKEGCQHTHLQAHAVHLKVGGVGIVGVHEPADIDSAGAVLVTMLG